MRFRRPRRSRNGKGPQGVELGESEPIEHHANVPQNSRLLNLPVEIRLQILRSIFSQHIIHFFIALTDEGAQFGWPQGRIKPTKPQIQSKWCSLGGSYRFNDTHELDQPGQGRHDVKLTPSQAIDILPVM
jgi:hypothetical protein